METNIGQKETGEIFLDLRVLEQVREKQAPVSGGSTTTGRRDRG